MAAPRAFPPFPTLLFLSLLGILLRGSLSSVTYSHSSGGEDFSTGDCEYLDCSGTAAQIECCESSPILNHWQDQVDFTIQQPAHLCNFHGSTCQRIPETMELSDSCTEMVSGCRSALRHLHLMMFSPQGEAQQCNNFARKSVRGIFHDFMSNGPDGSILSEHHVSMNFGLCRWAQYVNVLSDHTQCDSGSIIAMAAELGYEACGVPIWELDIAVKPAVHVNRPHACASNFNESPLYDPALSQRAEVFSDVQLSSNATAMEESWYAANGHTHDRPDGEIEYSAEAGAAAHAFGRVTCPPEGYDTNGAPSAHETGFFHVARTEEAEGDAKEFFYEAVNKISDTQCEEVDVGGGEAELHPTADGSRPESSSWPKMEGETDLNPEGGFCSMPTQFLGTVRIGGLHRIPRWMSITENSFRDPPERTEWQSECTDSIPLYIPYELLTLLDEVDVPSSPALTKFEEIAWDGIDRIDSAWDSCEVGCAIPVLENSLCGGGGLSDFDWELGYCDQGVGAGYACCDSACGTCSDDNVDECRPATILAEARECKSSWDTSCMIPKTGDGGTCEADDDCNSDSCRGGRCCNPHGRSEGCDVCGMAGGNCVSCEAGFKKFGPLCVDECFCSDACVDCDCGVCSECEDTHFLGGDEGGDCIPKRSAGAICSEDGECTRGSCRGGNCCDVEELQDGCIDCNARGLCSECDEGFTLCGHTEEDQGQCVEGVSSYEFSFVCGTGGEGSDFPSTDGYNYCGMANHCPCSRAGCYMDCMIDEVCWGYNVARGGRGGNWPDLGWTYLEMGYDYEPALVLKDGALPPEEELATDAPTEAPTEGEEEETNAPTGAPVTASPSPAPVPATEIEWTAGFTDEAARFATALAGADVVFTWSVYSNHNVFEMAGADEYAGCSFEGAVDLSAEPPVTWTVPDDAKVGDVYYFACEVGSHCGAGQKVEVVIVEGGVGQAEEEEAEGGAPEEAEGGAPEEAEGGAPEEDPAGAPEEDPAGAPEEDPAGAPEEDPAGAPEEDPTGAPEEDPAGAPSDSDSPSTPAPTSAPPQAPAPLVVAVPATLSIEIGSIPPAGSAAMKVLAAGLARSISDSVSAANPGAAARVLSVGGVPAARRLAAADVGFEVLLPAAAGVTEEEAAGMAGDAFEALGEAVAGDEFGEVLAESMQEAAGELVESGEMEAGEVDGVLESVRVEVSDVVAGEPEVLVVEEEVEGGGEEEEVGGEEEEEEEEAAPSEEPTSAYDDTSDITVSGDLLDSASARSAPALLAAAAALLLL